MAIKNWEWEWHVHGVNVHVQNEPDSIAAPEELGDVTTQAAPLYKHANPRRNGQGTTVRQNKGANWFHLAIPILTEIFERIPTDQWKDTPKDFQVKFWGRLNEQASLRKVEIWNGGAPNASRIFDYEWLGYAPHGVDFDESFYLEGVTDALVISMYVEFDEGGEVTFGGAGVRCRAIEWG